MPSAGELQALYGDIRAALLTRHFTMTRYFRANALLEGNHLGLTAAEVAHRKASSCGEANQNQISAPPVPAPGYGPPPAGTDILANFFALDRDPAIGQPQIVERYRVGFHDHENPLMNTGLLMMCLAIEHHLGRLDSVIYLRMALAAAGTLFKFGGEFAGYPVRWDAVLSDAWELDDQGALRRCCDFLTDSTGRYVYCTPLDDPRYRNRVTATDPSDEGAHRDAVLAFRRWEPSFDELVGLVLGYDMVFRFVHDQEVQSEVRDQVSKLGSYLATHAYLLVRPRRGFTARGASGFGPGLEFPFGQVFERITGQRFGAEASFEDALARAGLFESLKWQLRVAGFTGAAVGALVAPLTPILEAGAAIADSALLAQAGQVMGALTGAAGGASAARALTLYLSRDHFDVDPRAKGELALAYLLSNVEPASLRYTLGARAVAISRGAFANNFLVFAGLTGLDDSDSTARDGFFDWLGWRRQLHPRDSTGAFGAGAPGVFGRRQLVDAAASVLGGGDDDDLALAAQLTAMFEALSVPPQWGSDLPVTPAGQGVAETYDLGLEYMSCLALAWLRAQQPSSPSTPAIAAGLPRAAPDLSDPTALTAPVIPTAVVDQAQAGKLAVPVASALGAAGVGELLDGISPADAAVPKPREAPPAPPPAKVTIHIENMVDASAWSQSVTSTLEVTPPPRPSPTAVLCCDRSYDPRTVFRNIDREEVDEIGPLLASLGFTLGNFLCTVTTHSGSTWSSTGRYIADWTLYWGES